MVKKKTQKRIKMRKEKDFLGELLVPADAYYGIQTERAAQNFPISGLRSHPMMVKSMALIKMSAALANKELGRLEKKKADAIIKACDEIIRGKFSDQFIVDVFQMGAGTSFHMNLNEVIANRAEEILGGKLGEISLPAVAPGSSIMPGKVNPSMLEMMNMVCYQIMGCDLAVSNAAQAGQLELNVMMPVISFNLNLMIELMGQALRQVRTRCIEGIKANVERCREYAEKTLGLVTALSPRLGYALASEIAREAAAKKKTLREIIEQRGILPRNEVDEIFSSLKNPGFRAGRRGRS